MGVSYQDLARTGPGTIAGRFMRLFWQPVLVSEGLAAGRTKPIRIMGEDFTLYRGESGTHHLLEFGCAHRGTQLSTGWVEGDGILDQRLFPVWLVALSNPQRRSLLPIG